MTRAYYEGQERKIVSLTPEQEEFYSSLLINKKPTSLSRRYLKAIAHKIVVPEVICDYTFNSMEDAFKQLDVLEYSAEHSNDFDTHDLIVMQELQYWLSK